MRTCHRTILICALAGLSACAAVRRSSSVPLAESLQTLVPHTDGDHFVFVWQRHADDGSTDAGIQVEHVTALGAAGEFEVALTEDGGMIGKTQARDDGHALMLLGEDIGGRAHISYEPPLAQLTMPLRAGDYRTTVTAHAQEVGDPKEAGSLQVEQVVNISAAPPVHCLLGDFNRAVRVDTRRTLHAASRDVVLHDTMILVPGIGEVVSDGQATGAPAMHRELACATIGGRSFGDCHRLNAQVEELRHAGPAKPR